MAEKMSGLYLYGVVLGIKDTKSAESKMKILRVDDGEDTFNVLVVEPRLLGNVAPGKEVCVKLNARVRTWNGQPELSWTLLEVVGK